MVKKGSPSRLSRPPPPQFAKSSLFCAEYKNHYVSWNVNTVVYSWWWLRISYCHCVRISKLESEAMYPIFFHGDSYCDISAGLGKVTWLLSKLGLELLFWKFSAYSPLRYGPEWVWHRLKGSSLIQCFGAPICGKMPSRMVRNLSNIWMELCWYNVHYSTILTFSVELC